MKGLITKMLIAMLAISLAFGGAVSASAKSNGKQDHGYSNKGKHDDDHDKKEKKDKDKKDKDKKGKESIKLEFDDVDMEWARKHIASLAARGIFEGYADGTFQPNKPVTRQEAIVTAVRLMGLSDEAESTAKKNSHLNLKDEKNIADWARGYVAVALEKDLFFETDDKLQPNKSADRLWVTTVLVKALGLENEARAKMNTKLSFKDAKSIPAGSVGYIAVAVEKGIVMGYNDNTFQPNKPVTRAEIAAFLDRAGAGLPDDGALRGVLKSAVTNQTLVLDNGKSYVVDPIAFVYKDNKRISLAELKAGDLILFRTYNDIVIFIEVIKSNTNPNPDPGFEQKTVAGYLSKAVDKDVLTLTTTQGKTESYKLASNAIIVRNGAQVKAVDLKVGDELTAHVVNGSIVMVSVTKLASDLVEVKGSVVMVSSDKTILVIHTNGKDQVYLVDPNASIYRNGKQVALDQLKVSDAVTVKLLDHKIIYVNVTEMAEYREFIINGLFQAMTLNAQGKISTISVIDLSSSNNQVSIYNVATDVKISGDLTKLIIGNQLELKGKNQQITHINIK